MWGQIAGIEAAVHATRAALESEESQAALLVDATNAFNTLNRQVALHNIRRLCPPIATILINSYTSSTELFLDGDIILSQEGTTQGDPLAMAMYGLATIPLIRRLDGLCTQVWCTDDSAAIGKLTQLQEWWDKLTTDGPRFGYFANPSKTWLVIKDDHHEEASAIFADSGVNITSDGRPYLGASIGSQEFMDYVRSKVKIWSSNIAHLSEIAKSQPHASFTALTHGLQSKWSYLCRVIHNIGHLLSPLDEMLRSDLLPALTGRPSTSDLECALFTLPPRLGGLGIRITSETAASELHAILPTAEGSEPCQGEGCLYMAHCSLFFLLPITALPLHKSAFHDALALRYGWTPSKLPSKCDCDNSFTVEHALSCARGGLSTIRNLRPYSQPTHGSMQRCPH